MVTVNRRVKQLYLKIRSILVAIVELPRKFRVIYYRRKYPIVYVEPCYYIFDQLDENSVIIDIGLGHDADFSSALNRRYACRCYGVDPTMKHGSTTISEKSCVGVSSGARGGSDAGARCRRSEKKFILVGCGAAGRSWVVNTMRPLVFDTQQAEPVAVADINPESLGFAGEGYSLPVEKTYTDMKKAFDENEADFVIVVVPPTQHELVVDQALAHGMDILSEKPITDSMESTVKVYKKVKRAGRKMAVTMSHRYDQDEQSLEREIKSGKYGALDYLVGRNTWNCRKYPAWGAFRYEIPDPLLIEGVVHHFDIIRALSGSNAKSVFACSWNPAWSEFKGDAMGLFFLEMENGVKASYEGAKANATTLNGWSRTTSGRSVSWPLWSWINEISA